MKHSTKQTRQNGEVKVMTHYRNIRPARSLDSLIEETIGELGGKMTVESAEVTVERSMSDHPPVRTSILIVTPGPDIEVEARDYTSAAAYNKAWRALQRRAEAKAAHRGDSKRRANPRPARAAHQQGRF